NTEPAELRAEREKMIILYPECRVRFVEAQQGSRHEGVDFAIGEVIALRGADQIAARMQRRPQRRIGEAFVISAIMRRRQIEQCKPARAERLDLGEGFLLLSITPAA